MNLINVLWIEENREPVLKTIEGNLKSFEQQIGNYIKANEYRKSEAGEILIISSMDNEVTSIENIKSTCFLLKVDADGKYSSLSSEEINDVILKLSGN